MAYATQNDLLNLGFPQNALGNLSAGQVTANLQAASDYLDSKFRARYGIAACPLTAWDTSVTMAVAKMAAFRLLVVRGFSPNSTADQRFKQANDEAVQWIDDVQRQQAHPAVVLANGASPQPQPILSSFSVVNLGNGASGPNRGW